ncbi:hypothetical protein XS16_002786 [Salmonella enterica subsp. enterica serovar Newport]|nr:hypothetical protein [Salmonella enterica subsp. enterica serovar Infantis]EDT3086429.1 hypothetical protein [Salmonella enterica subsp. enterica serovar Newport]EGI5077172.1 hypothetical protein [Salmonella enterica subsp. enterica serovar Infantis]
MATRLQIIIEDKGGHLDIQVGGVAKEPLTKREAEFTTNLALGIRKAVLVMGGKNAGAKADVAEILKATVTKTH